MATISMVSMASIEAWMAKTKFEDNQDAREDGARGIVKAREQRADVRQKLDDLRERGYELKAEAADEADASWFGEHFFEGLFGIDDAGEIQEKQLTLEADIKKGQAELEQIRGDQQDLLGAIRDADKSLKSTLDAVAEMLSDQETTVRDAGR